MVRIADVGNLERSCCITFVYHTYRVTIFTLDLVIKLGPATHGKDGLYEYTVISTPRKTLMWVLARNAKQFKAKYDTEVRQYLEKNGFTWFWNKPRPTYQGDDCVYPPM